jgi:hypothetical protein
MLDGLGLCFFVFFAEKNRFPESLSKFIPPTERHLLCAGFGSFYPSQNCEE